MRRAPFVLAGTAAGLIAVLSFHTRSPQAAALPGPGGRAGTSPGTSASPQPGPGPGTVPAVTASPLPKGSRTVTGPVEQYSYGSLAVRVTAAGRRIVAVTVSALSVPDPYSRQLDQQAIPTLRAEVLQAQSARIHGVSGATFTSQAYAQSLQAALDRLHLR